MTTFATYLGIGLLLIGIGLAAANLRGWWVERGLLRRQLEAWVPGGAVRRREDLVELRRALRQRIRFDLARMHDPRPFLRASATETLRAGYGFCGENARVAVSLLRLGGVRAHRLYLFGARWGHVAVEHWWDGGWRLFDGHDDPLTAPADDQLGVLSTSDVSALPNEAEENPWRAAATSKLLRRVPGLARMRPPALAVAVAESPHLVRVTLGVALAVLGLALLLVG